MKDSLQEINGRSRSAANAQLQTIYAVNDMLRQIDLDGDQLDVVIPKVLSLAIEEINADHGSIFILNKNHKVENAWLTLPETRPALDDILKKGVGGWVIRNQQACLINNTNADDRWLKNPDLSIGVEPQSVICLPFTVGGEAFGALTVLKAGVGQFDERDLDLLTIIANQTARAIETIRLYQESQRQLKVSHLLNQASREINSSLHTDETLQSLLSQMNELLNAEALSIALVDEQTNELVFRVAAGIGGNEIVGLRLPANQGLSGWVMRHMEPALVADIQNDERFYRQGDERTGYPTQAMICAPVQFKGEVLGTIQAINPSGGVFTDDDLELLTNLANIAGNSIAHAQQFAQTRAAQARYERLFEDSIDPIILTNEEGIVVDANKRAFDFLGYSQEELTGLAFSDLFSDKTEWPSMNSVGSKALPFRGEITKSDLLPVSVEVHAKLTIFENHELVQWIIHDITEQVELEQMREDLIAMLFHDLQSPLGNVITSLDLLAGELEGGDEVQLAMLGIATRSSHQLRTLIHSLLDITKLEANQPLAQGSVNVYELVDTVAESKADSMNKRGVRMKRELEADLPAIYAEKDMVQRVLINLLDNALKYGAGSEEITVAARRDGNMTLFSVSDQGPGVPEEYRAVIFEKFGRMKYRNTGQKGLGLGLAFCNLAVQGHNGRIWVDDAPGGGARFNFTIPILEDTPVDEAAEVALND